MITSVPLSALTAPKGNPRRTLDKARIADLAESIKTDGVLQNLIVEPAGTGTYRVVTGKRRLLALKLLKRQKHIDDDFAVPVEIREDLERDDALRIATVENVQREALSPIDEADAFSALLQNGAMIEEVTAKTGVSAHTIRRRLALTNLCDEAKKALEAGDLPLGIAEAMTLGVEAQQRAILNDIRDGADYDRDTIRHMLLSEKASTAIAIFPLEQYTGTCTRDLFGDEETTYFDDIEQFFALQKEAVERLAENHGKKAAWVDVFNTYSVPWWQYRQAEEGDEKGVVINLTPTGRVEVKKNLARHEVKSEVVTTTRETPLAPKERPQVAAGLVRYVALHKSIAVQAALFRDPRRAKEVAAVQLLLALRPRHAVKIDVHPCITAFGEIEEKPRAFMALRAEASRLLGTVGVTGISDDGLPPDSDENTTPLALYELVKLLSQDELDRLVVLLPLLSFGQDGIAVLDTDTSLFNRVAEDLGLSMREWWVPDAAFLGLLRRDQLEAAAIECGASLRMGRFKDYTKTKIVEFAARYFERTADPEATLDEHDAKGRLWLPGVMRFPAKEAITAAQ